MVVFNPFLHSRGVPIPQKRTHETANQGDANEDDVFYKIVLLSGPPG
jgi:hypothetical protein